MAVLDEARGSAPGISECNLNLNQSAITEDSRNYFWGIARFKVADVRFQVPLSPFVKGSKFFAECYGLVTEPSTNGVLESFIPLKGVDAQSFERFLEALLPVYSLGPQVVGTLTLDEWITVLRLATRWKFNELRQCAIGALEDDPGLTSTHRTKLAKELSIPAWLMKGYKGVVEELLTWDVDGLDEAVERRKASMELIKKEAKVFGWEVVFELQCVAITRQDIARRLGRVGWAEDDIMASDLLRQEYERIVKEGKAYMTVQEFEAEQRRTTREGLEREQKEKGKGKEARGPAFGVGGSGVGRCRGSSLCSSGDNLLGGGEKRERTSSANDPNSVSSPSSLAPTFSGERPRQTPSLGWGCAAGSDETNNLERSSLFDHTSIRSTPTIASPVVSSPPPETRNESPMPLLGPTPRPHVGWGFATRADSVLDTRHNEFQEVPEGPDEEDGWHVARADVQDVNTDDEWALPVKIKKKKKAGDEGDVKKKKKGSNK